ncbi:MAG TPA: chromate efflux transporter [Candidatus Polarisedimenticolia bacterium]|nr:chromate efflux transporter [Candidatus Polarisedimenticolia bacterium]
MSPAQGVPFREAFRFWVRLGFINFGGPAGQIAIMHRELVERKRWITEEQFLRALNFCMILPGPEAQQLAIYTGWRLHGTLGGLAAGSFFVIPSIFVLMFLSWLAAARADVPAIAGLLYGVQPVVIAIVAEAVMRIGRRALHHRALLLFAAAAFLALFVFGVPFPAVIAAAALAGMALQRRWPQVFRPRGHVPGAAPAESAPPTYPPLSRLVRIGLLFLLLWTVPVGGLWLWRGGADVLVREALFFTRAAFVTFGGAYAVLSYVADVAVNHYGWLAPQQMVQGLALAESTPGPLIMVTQFVGFLGAWTMHGGFDPLANAVLGGLVTTYVTFLPCFMFIFAGAPYVELLAGNRRIQAALVGVTSAVVGVILNLAVTFGGRVLFPGVGVLDAFALALALLSFLLLKTTRLPIHLLVPAGAMAGMVWRLIAQGGTG